MKGAVRVDNSTKSTVKIILISVIVLAVIAIWGIKNQQKDNSFKSDNADFDLNVTEALDMEKLKSYGIPILIEFGSETCDPCKTMAPIIAALNEELQGKAIVRYVNVGTNPEFSTDYPVSVIPTQLFIDADGNPYYPADIEASTVKIYTHNETGEHYFTTHEGTMTKDELLSILREMGMEE